MIRYILLVFYIFVNSYFRISAQDTSYSLSAADYAAIDAYAASKEAQNITSVPELINYLKKDAHTDSLKARAAFRWLTENVRYDVAALSMRTYPDQSPANVCKTRKSVCQGYANLFETLCKGMGLECITITGYAKNLDFKIGTTFKAPNHAWNAVKLGAKWELVDATWGAGFLMNGQFHRRLANIFFLTPPDVLQLTHLPVEPKWQLTPSRITMAEFLELPIPSYYSSLKINKPKQAYLSKKEPTYFDIEVEEAIEVYVIEGDGQKPEQRLLLNKNGIRFTGTKEVKHKDVGIFAKYPSTGDSYTQIVKYRSK